ncbi:hypothetical protein HHK36_020601 [Tetracentron sinense]|uniref:Pentatricopeptide repeat-containing protein n=1 Tax=Tetracentron sinense TaxID=13715 RepID=A0A835D8I3_TETSI|nr:hypothetical protein HHK36_020601 [Tetracentron sinense]
MISLNNQYAFCKLHSTEKPAHSHEYSHFGNQQFNQDQWSVTSMLNPNVQLGNQLSTLSAPGVCQNPRFVSHDSSPRDQDSSSETYSDQNSSIVSPESEPLIHDENPNFGSQFSNNIADDMDIENNSHVLSEEFAEEIEAKIPEIDIEKFENVLSLLQSSLDGSLESSLDNMELTVNEEFLVRVIETPLVPGDNLIGIFKWASRNPEFLITSRVVDSLVRAISAGLRKKEAYSLWDLVKEIGENEKGVLNTEILNELISLFWKLGKGKAGFEVFNKFEEFGCEPNSDSYYFTIEALCRRSIFDWAWSVCEKMLNAGSLPDSEKIGKIISCFCRGSKAKDAHLVYLMAKEKNKYPPQSSINFLTISLCEENGTVQLAVELLEDFSGEARKYAIKSFASVVRGLCRIKDVEGAKKLLFKMIDGGPHPGNAVFNSVINGLSKAGEMEEAMRMLKLMESRGLRPDVYTYTVIMSGYTKGGQMEDAYKVLLEARKKHSKLNPVTYHILIRGYCKLEEFDKALKLLSEMKEDGVQPNADEYNKMVQSLCLKALDWGTAEILLEEMKEKGLYLNGITRGLIRAVKELEEEEVQAGVAAEVMAGLAAWLDRGLSCVCIQRSESDACPSFELTLAQLLSPLLVSSPFTVITVAVHGRHHRRPRSSPSILPSPFTVVAVHVAVAAAWFVSVSSIYASPPGKS